MKTVANDNISADTRLNLMIKQGVDIVHNLIDCGHGMDAIQMVLYSAVKATRISSTLILLNELEQEGTEEADDGAVVEVEGVLDTLDHIMERAIDHDPDIMELAARVVNKYLDAHPNGWLIRK